jgi:ribosomal-protein-alanine N-acetyltransferase
MSDLRPLPETFDIREAESKDAAAIAEIETLCFSPPWSLEDFLYEIEENELAHYLACFDGPRLIAYAGLWAVLNEGHISNVAVHPDFRGRGVGAALIDALIEWARRLWELSDFTLEVRASNVAAIRLYQNAGFREEGRRRRYYTNPTEEAIIMWLRNI